MEVYPTSQVGHTVDLVPERHRYSIRKAIEKLKEEIPLKHYAGELVELKRQGPNLVGLCPIHDEKTPSFTVYPDDHFHCFGCKAHGDIIDLCAYVEHHGDTWTAVVSLSMKFGVALPGRPPKWFGWQDEKEKQRREIVDVLTEGYQRRYFRVFAPLILESIGDPEEHEHEARRLWEGFGRVGRSVARRKVYTDG